MKKVLLAVCAAMALTSFVNAQTFQWVKGGGGTQPGYTLTQSEQVRFMCTDSNRNLYVVSTVLVQSLAADTFYTSYGHYPTNQQILLSSYRCDGTMRWARLFEGYTEMSIGGLVYDGAGGVYMSGNNGSYNYPMYLGDGAATMAHNYKTSFVVKYDTSGNKQWIQFVGPATATSIINTRSTGLAMDGQGNIHNFVTTKPGMYLSSTITSSQRGTYDMKYSSSGTLMSTTRLGIDSMYFLEGGVVISRTSNKIYGIVQLDPNFTSGSYFALCAFNASGSLLWRDTTGDRTGLNGIAYDNANGIYCIAGANGGPFKLLNTTITNTLSSTGNLCNIIKLDTAGSIKWINTTENNDAVAAFFGLGIQSGNKLIAGGYASTVTRNGSSTFTIPANNAVPFYTVLDTSGNLIKLDYLHTNGLYSFFTSIAVDKAGSAYMGGIVEDSIKLPSGQFYKSHGGNSDFFITKYGYACNCTAPASAFTSKTTAPKTVQFTYSGTATGIDSLVWNFGDGQKQKVTSGYTTPITHTYATGNAYNACAIVYGSCGTNQYCKQALSVGSMSALEGVKVYPNPATDNLVIEGAEGATAMLTNSIGQQIMSLELNSPKQTVSLSSLSSGIYILSLQTKEGLRGAMRITKQ